MIDREHDLSITKQAEVLKISRGSVYYLPRPVSSADLAIIGIRVDCTCSVARHAGFAGVPDRPPACEDADAEDGNRGALSSSAHHEARTGPQDPSVSAARHRDHA